MYSSHSNLNRSIGNALVDGLYKAADTHIWNKPGQVSYRIISGTRLLDLSAHCLELNSQELEAAEYFESLLFDAVDMNQPTLSMTWTAKARYLVPLDPDLHHLH